MGRILTSASRIRSGDIISANGEEARKVNRISSCLGKAENIHLDHECWDMRFTKFERITP